MNVQEWLALREFLVPESGLEATVLRAGILLVPTAHLEAAGIRDALPIDPEGTTGLLGTITVESSGGPELLRLSSTLAGWAAECFVSAQQGRKPFPARVRFRKLGSGFSLTVLEGPSLVILNTAPSPKELAVCVDESGNTGDAVAASHSAPFGGQPSFALAAVGEARDSGQIAKLIDQLRARHGIRAAELKGRTMKRYPTLVTELVGSLYAPGLPIFIEVMDKEYYLATSLVSFFLGKAPWFDVSSASGKTVANAVADLVVEDVGTSGVASYADFARTPSADALARFVTVFRTELASAALKTSRDAERRRLLETASALFEDAYEAYVQAASHEPSAFRTLLPPPDSSLRGVPIAMLPHVPAFANLYARINRYAQDASRVYVLHDEQSHFGPLLRKYAADLESNEYAIELFRLVGPQDATWTFTPGKFTLAFGESHGSAGIQAADLLARVCTRRLTDVTQSTKSQDGDVIRVLGELRDATKSVGLNIVSTKRRVERFYAE